MTIKMKGKDFKKAFAFIKDFLQKIPEDAECAQLRDSLNLSLLYMKKYFRTVWLHTQEKHEANDPLSSSLPRVVSPTVPHYDTPDRFSWRWVPVVQDNARLLRCSLPADGGRNLARVPLILQAAKEGDKELIEQLIEKEPSCVNAVDEFGRTSAMYAVHFGEQECLDVLLRGKVDTSHQAHDGSTVLHIAIHDGNYDAVELLLKHQAIATLQDSQGRAPVHWVTALPDTQCLQLLLKCNIDVNVRDRDGLTPAMWACHMDNQKHFDLLTSSENNKIAENDGIERDAVGRTWIHWAVRRSDPLKCLRNLLTAETAAIKDNEGRSVIHISAQIGALEACKIIMTQVGISCLNDVDNQNRTCLHMAAMAAHGEVLNYLLEQGADVNIRDCSNLTAWDYSCNRNLYYCMMIIRSFHTQHKSSQSDGKAEEDELEDIEENNNCAILPSEHKSITHTPPVNDKLGVPCPPNQPKPLFQTIPAPSRAHSPRPKSPKAKVPFLPPVKALEESKLQNEHDTEEDSEESSPHDRGSAVAINDENLQEVDVEQLLDMQYTTESGDIVQSADDAIISSDMQPSHQTINGEEQPPDEESAIPDGGFQNRQRSISLGSDDVSEQSINIGMDVSDIEDEGQSNGNSTEEERPVEPISSPKQMTPPHLAKPTSPAAALLLGRSSSSPVALPRPPSPGPAMLYQTGQISMHNVMQNNHRDNSVTSSSPLGQDQLHSFPSPLQGDTSPRRRLIPLGGGGGGLVAQSNNEDMAQKTGNGKKKKKKKSSLRNSIGDNALQRISAPKHQTALLNPLHGGPKNVRAHSPSNNLQHPSLSGGPLTPHIDASTSPRLQRAKNNLQPSTPLGPPKSPHNDNSTSPRPPTSRGSIPQPPASHSVPSLPQAQGKAREMSWGPKQPKVPSTPTTPRDQRAGSSLLSPAASSLQPTHPGDGDSQRSPKDGKKLLKNATIEGLGLHKGMHKPQPFHPQGRPLAPMRPGGSGSFPQRTVTPKISQSPRQHAPQSSTYTQPLNPAPPRGKNGPGGYSI